MSIEELEGIAKDTVDVPTCSGARLWETPQLPGRCPQHGPRPSVYRNTVVKRDKEHILDDCCLHKQRAPACAEEADESPTLPMPDSKACRSFEELVSGAALGNFSFEAVTEHTIEEKQRLSLLVGLGHWLEMRLAGAASMTAPPDEKEPATAFHAKGVPNSQFSVGLSLSRQKRSLQQLGVHDEHYVVASVYVDRALRSEPKLELSASTVPRLWPACLLLASKFLEDGEDGDVDISRFAKATGVETRFELLRLEAKLLEVLEWRLHVNAVEYKEYEQCFRLQSSAPCVAVAA